MRFAESRDARVVGKQPFAYAQFPTSAPFAADAAVPAVAAASAAPVGSAAALQAFA